LLAWVADETGRGEGCIPSELVTGVGYGLLDLLLGGLGGVGSEALTDLGVEILAAHVRHDDGCWVEVWEV
jgi:hypothetical protein